VTLSVCATTLNARPYVDRWHASLQGAFPDEVVVVDAGSTDGTPERLRELGCRVVEFPCDLGSGRNAAIGAARGDTVLVCDADNEYYRPDLATGSRPGRFRVLVDRAARSVWTVTGARSLFLRYPFVKVRTWGTVRDDLIFFARAPVDFMSLPDPFLWVDTPLGRDLKRGGVDWGRRPVVWLRNRAWFGRGGFTIADGVRLSARLARGRDWRYAADIAGVTTAHVLTAGASGRGDP
jgi:glycosyltransferase involved in cell wall biosynthesis